MMKSFLRYQPMFLIKGIIFFLIVVLNTVFWVPILVFFSLFKFLLPIKAAQKSLSRFLVWIAESWIYVNTASHKLFHGQKVHLNGFDELQHDDWYLVISNHQAVADIPILQNAFYKKVPFLKFFLKRELIWVPFLGVAWWALDFPFMRRFSAAYLAKNPKMKGKDLEATKLACEKFKDFPISVLNFVEGTRFSLLKQQKQHAKFKHLLKPKSGGIGFVLGSMGEQINYLLLTSIKYHPKTPSAWEYMTGRFEKVEVEVSKIVIPPHLKNKNYVTDLSFRKDLQKWLNELWQTVDGRLS